MEREYDKRAQAKVDRPTIWVGTLLAALRIFLLSADFRLCRIHWVAALH